LAEAGGEEPNANDEKARVSKIIRENLNMNLSSEKIIFHFTMATVQCLRSPDGVSNWQKYTPEASREQSNGSSLSVPAIAATRVSNTRSPATLKNFSVTSPDSRTANLIVVWPDAGLG
jgi:hypothetical protein